MELNVGVLFCGAAIRDTRYGGAALSCCWVCGVELNKYGKMPRGFLMPKMDTPQWRFHRSGTPGTRMLDLSDSDRLFLVSLPFPPTRS